MSSLVSLPLSLVMVFSTFTWRRGESEKETIERLQAIDGEHTWLFKLGQHLLDGVDGQGDLGVLLDGRQPQVVRVRQHGVPLVDLAL